MSDIIFVSHPRHREALDILKVAARKIPADQKCIVIVYDGPVIPSWARAASYCATDATKGDVKTICQVMTDQINA